MKLYEILKRQPLLVIVTNDHDSNDEQLCSGDIVISVESKMDSSITKVEKTRALVKISSN